MATFIERKNAQGEIIGYQVKIRHAGLAPQSKTFTKKADAKRWAEKIETEIKDLDSVAYRASLLRQDLLV